MKFEFCPRSSCFHLVQRWLLVISCIFVAFISISCDLEGKKDCDWVLEPEPTLKKKVEKGFIPVCARNRKTQKQDCRLQTKIEFAKSAIGKKFRYTDLKIVSVALPRTIKSIKYCKN